MVDYSTKRDQMGNRIITAQVSEKTFECIDSLVAQGYYCSRSDAIRGLIAKSIDLSRNNGMV